MTSPTAGQPVLVGGSLLDDTHALEERLTGRERDRSAAHAALLGDVLRLVRRYEQQGWGVGTVAQLALLLDCSEARAADLCSQASLLPRLAGAMDALAAGELTEEQCRVLAERLCRLAGPDAELVWQQVLARLRTRRAAGQVFPPRRLDDLVVAVVAELLPQELAGQRRQQEQHETDVVFRHRDGVVDLHAYGISGPNAQAALGNLHRRSQPFGPDDPRTAGQRRRDALVDLLTGRDPLPLPGHGVPVVGCHRQAAGTVVDDDGRVHRDPRDAEPDPAGRATVCGCPSGTAVPCGTDVRVLVPLATALGLSAVPGLITGPLGQQVLDVELIGRLLANAPRLTAVFVDDNGVPVAVGDRRVEPPVRHDPDLVRQAVLALVGTSRPGAYFPTGPGDHPWRPPEREPGSAPPPPAGAPARGQAHPDAAETAYRVRPRLGQLVTVRAPRCEWPGCGARAVRCDLDHDVAWPHGPTCACNLGPLCRHHHRIKQAGWRKHRQDDGSVRWTSPTGRTWRSPLQLPAPPVPAPPVPAPPVPAPPVPAPPAPVPPVPPAAPTSRPDDQLLPWQAEDELWLTDPGNRWFDGLDDGDWQPQDPDQDPDPDRLGTRLLDPDRNSDDAWQLALADPGRWTAPTGQPLPEPPDWRQLDGPAAQG